MISLTGFTLRIIAGAAVLLVAGALLAYVARRRRVSRALGDMNVLRMLLGEDLLAIPWGRIIAVWLATAAIALALIDPALAARRSGGGGPIVLLLDASGSMLVDDVGPRRLDLQREVAADFVRLVPDLPIGVVAFAGRAFTLTPPTRDRAAVDMYLATLDPSIVTQTGSALGAAIRQGVGLLAGEEGTAGGTIILFGDGDETEDVSAAVAAASLARRSGIAVHVVGIGTEQGGPIPALDLATGATQGFLRDPTGAVQVSRVGEDLLRDLARRSAGGVYLLGRDPRASETLAELARVSESPTEVPDEGFPPYAWLAITAVLLLTLEPLATREGRGR